MKPKYFWLLSDGKTIREISRDEYLHLHARNWQNGLNTFQLIVSWNNEIHFEHGKAMLNVRLRQLTKILEGTGR